MASDFAYDHETFWRDPPDGALGPWDPANPDTSSPELNRQQAAILKILGSRTKRIKSIFEAGCGQGRLTRFLHNAFPEASYEAIDLNPEHIKSAQRFNPYAKFEVADLTTYDAHSRYDDKSFDGFDLVIASEVLMHLPPHLVERAMQTLLHLVNAEHGYLLTVDWVPLPGELVRLARRQKHRQAHTPPSGIAPWNFNHDYAKIYHNVGTISRHVRTDRQMIYLVKP